MEIPTVVGILLTALGALIVGLAKMFEDKLKALRGVVGEQQKQLSDVRHRVVELEINTERGTAVKELIRSQQLLREDLQRLTALVKAYTEARDVINGERRRKRQVDP